MVFGFVRKDCKQAAQSYGTVASLCESSVLSKVSGELVILEFVSQEKCLLLGQSWYEFASGLMAEFLAVHTASYLESLWKMFLEFVHLNVQYFGQE